MRARDFEQLGFDFPASFTPTFWGDGLSAGDRPALPSAVRKGRKLLNPLKNP